jgi:hypothetical protein
LSVLAGAVSSRPQSPSLDVVRSSADAREVLGSRAAARERGHGKGRRRRGQGQKAGAGAGGRSRGMSVGEGVVDEGAGVVWAWRRLAYSSMHLRDWRV